MVKIQKNKDNYINLKYICFRATNSLLYQGVKFCLLIAFERWKNSSQDFQTLLSHFTKNINIKFK